MVRLIQHRSLFADKAFDKDVYQMREQTLLYDDYAAGNVPKINDPGVPKTTMQVLRRNRSKRVDMFLDWLVRV